MQTKNMADTYRNQQIMTAPPEELTMMLFNGVVRFSGESIRYLEENKYDKCSNASIRAQAILMELMTTLDMNYEISKNLYSLYEYCKYLLLQGNIKKDKLQLEQAKNILIELRDTWADAIKIFRAERKNENNAAIYGR